MVQRRKLQQVSGSAGGAAFRIRRAQLELRHQLHLFANDYEKINTREQTFH